MYELNFFSPVNLSCVILIRPVKRTKEAKEKNFPLPAIASNCTKWSNFLIKFGIELYHTFVSDFYPSS